MSNVLVVAETDISKLKSGYTPGFWRGIEGEILEDPMFQAITKRAFWVDRELAEKTPDFKQLIVYSVLVDLDKRKIFLYQRSSEGQYKERRLRGKWSCGLGGHVDQAKDGTSWPLLNSFFREMREEVGLDVSLSDFKPFGYVYDPSDDVGRVHLGILNLVMTGGEVTPKDKEISSGRMVDLSEAEKIIKTSGDEVESWTKIAFSAVCNRFFS